MMILWSGYGPSGLHGRYLENKHIALAGAFPIRCEHYEAPITADRGAIIPLDDYCTSYGISADLYIPVYWQLCRYRGHVFALPTTPGDVALHWNKRLFREAGLDPDRPPRTIEELDQYAERLTKRDCAGRITQVGFIHSEPGWWHWSWGCFFGAVGSGMATAGSPRRSIAPVVMFAVCFFTKKVLDKRGGVASLTPKTVGSRKSLSEEPRP